MDVVAKTVKEIRALKIQGASNIRKKAVNALLWASEKSKAKTTSAFRLEFLKHASILYSSRPTEPELRTSLRIIKKSISNKDLSVKEMKENIKIAVKKYETNRLKAINDISIFGANLIENGSVVMTICHSSTVIEMLTKAKKKIKKVYCLETRPLYQGRITAKELAKAGLNVTLLVDNAASTVMKECDYLFSGADAFLADGDVINKIGTNQVSYLCKRYDVKHYAVASTHKFEPATFFGKQEPIEQRSPDEIWSEKEKKKFGAKKVKINNPAFDRTDSKTLEGIICEIGVFSPQTLAARLYEELDLKKHEKEFLKL